MVKPHKDAWTGVDIETTLSFEQLANIAERAAQQSTGDVEHGKHRITSSRLSDRQIEFRINDYLVSYQKHLVFFLDFAERGGQMWVTSRIDWYETSQPKFAGIPTGAKVMLGHHTYMQFVRTFADLIRAVDPRARVSLRDPAYGGQPVQMLPQTPAQPTQPDGYPYGPYAGSGPPPTPQPGGGAPQPWQGQSRVGTPGLQISPSPAQQFQPDVSVAPMSPIPPARHDQPGPSATPILPVPPGPPPYRPGQPLSDGIPPDLAPGQSGPRATPPQLPASFAPPAEVLAPPDEALAPAPKSAPVGAVGSFRPAPNDSMSAPSDLVSSVPKWGTEAAAASPTWQLRTVEGEVIEVGSAIVVGRNPSAPPAAPDAIPVPLHDRWMSMSKSHALLNVRDGQLLVTDLHSTNGTRLIIDAEPRTCAPGQPTPVGAGWQVRFGEFIVEVSRV